MPPTFVFVDPGFAGVPLVGIAVGEENGKDYKLVIVNFGRCIGKVPRDLARRIQE